MVIETMPHLPLTCACRDAAVDTRPDRQWLLFDGPVDAGEATVAFGCRGAMTALARSATHFEQFPAKNDFCSSNPIATQSGLRT